MSMAVSPGRIGSGAPASAPGGAGCLTPLVHVGCASAAGTEPLRQHEPTSGGRVTYVYALHLAPSAVQADWQMCGSE